METVFARNARLTPLSGQQRQVLLGSLLGDGYLMPTTSGHCFRVGHGLAQAGYVDWKYRHLRDFVRSAPRASGRTYYFRTISMPELSAFRQLWYRTGRKSLPAESLQAELGPLGLAVWFMDDGSLEGRQVRINSQSFSLDENEQLSGFLRAKFGIESRLNLDKGRGRLRISEASIGRLKSLIGPHIIPEMLYKLPP